jgi:DeoR family fructose operon transcriptional repressor
VDILPLDHELTIITHSVSIALRLVTRPNVTVMLVGGRLRSRTLAAVDAWALQTLRDTVVDIAFIATDGVSTDRGLTTPDLAEAMVKRAAIASSRRSVLLADHTKVGNAHFARFADLSDIDTFITDSGIDGNVAAEIAGAGPKVITV